MSPPVLVTGATGQVGLFVIAELLNAGRPVIACLRQSAPAGETEIPGLSCCQPGEVDATLPRSELGLVLLSCGPMGVMGELLDALHIAQGPAIRRVVVTGTTSLAVKQDSPDPAERKAIAEIRSARLAIERACRERAIPLFVLHPTLIYGCGMDHNLSRVYRWIRRFGIAPLATPASGLRQPLHVADLAASLARAASDEEAPALESPLCGGETLPYREMIGRLFDAAGRRRRMPGLPAWALRPAAWAGSLLAGRQRIHAEMFRRQSQDLVFDDTVARDALKHHPRDFRPTAADFELPHEIERIRHALRC